MRSPPTRVLTLGLGRKFYFDLACNLARSFLRHHRPEELPFTIVTDLAQPLPADLAGCTLQKVATGRFGHGFGPKLCLDQICPEGATLFLDADILIYAPLHALLDRLAGRAVATFGQSVADGEWFGDVGAYCRSLGVSAIPKFNGGIYYLEPGDTARAVYVTAREIAGRYDELGLVRLRGQPNDEIAMAGAMAVHGLTAIADDGSVMADPQACPGPMTVNILRGKRTLTNPPPGSRGHCPWNPYRRQSPVLVHYLGEHAQRPLYRTEAKRLQLVSAGWHRAAADAAARLCVLWPGQLLETVKTALRPVFHRIFGVRRIFPTARE